MRFNYTTTEQDFIDLNFLSRKMLGQWRFKKLFFVEFISFFFIAGGIYMIKTECFCLKDILWYFGICIPAIVLVSFLIASYQRHCVKKELVKYAKMLYSESMDYAQVSHEAKDEFLYTTTQNSTLNTKYESIKNIVKTEDRFFVMLGNLRGFIFGIDEQSEEFVKLLCQKSSKKVEYISINGYKNRFWG